MGSERETVRSRKWLYHESGHLTYIHYQEKIATEQIPRRL